MVCSLLSACSFSAADARVLCMRCVACQGVILHLLLLRAVPARCGAACKRLTVIWVGLNSCHTGKGWEAEYCSGSKWVSWNRSPNPLIINAKLQSNFPRMPHLSSLRRSHAVISPSPSHYKISAASGLRGNAPHLAH